MNRKSVPHLSVLTTGIAYICLLYYKIGGGGQGLGLGLRQIIGLGSCIWTLNIDNRFQAKCAYKGRCLYLFLILQTRWGGV